VTGGTFQQAEFAADLWQVYLSEAITEYQKPEEFFNRTFITEGLKNLLTNAVKRLSGKGGDPVIELQTNFGGGKTHSMLALWHLFSGAKVSRIDSLSQIIKDSGCQLPSNVHRAVFVGTKISPGSQTKKKDGTVVRTIWGEIAWQLGGKAGYEMVAKDDENATNPGDKLKELFNRFSPCLILIDEWVAYARQLREENILPAGNFGTQFTFAQALSESAKAAKNTLLVVSTPESENESGGEWGRKSLSRLKNAIGRVESSWRPASSDEGFEIVRRRLFEPMVSQKSKETRDAVAKAFVDMYKTNQAEFPAQCHESQYQRRLELAYPIHPELFDRLYNDWSALDKFQRTRGVLRLMAAVIHCLWVRNDQSLLIMPSTIPIDDSRTQFELTRYLDDQWGPIIDKDVDGEQSLPQKLDNDIPNLGRYTACRRVARTLYIGSAPTKNAANRGIDEKLVKLGCVQPDETVATYGDALRRLSTQATYLYTDGTRYWFSTQPTVNSLAEDRANQFTENDVYDEISKRLREATRTRGGFSQVHSCVRSEDVPDIRNARLVILAPEQSHTQNQNNSPARREAAAILNSRGSNLRLYKNSLVFLAGDSDRLEDLKDVTRRYLAWKSIYEDREPLNLDPLQSNQAKKHFENANETVASRLPETWRWLLIPCQLEPKDDLEWQEKKLSGNDGLIVRVYDHLINDGLLYAQLGGVNLRRELDRIPLWRGNDVTVKQLIDDFAAYVYLSRLLEPEVLIKAVKNGISQPSWKTDTFAYAQSKSEEGRYLGLIGGQDTSVTAEGGSLVVKPTVADEQMINDLKAIPTEKPRFNVDEGSRPTPQEIIQTPETPALFAANCRRFHGSVRFDPLLVLNSAEKVDEEVILLFNKLINAEVKVTMEIEVNLPNGVTEKTVQVIMENCQTLNFDSYGFEKE
jgi:predicted AAA+ superfamily ATPase